MAGAARGMCALSVVLCLRNKYLNPKPNESLSTEVGRDGTSCVCVSRPNPTRFPSTQDSRHTGTSQTLSPATGQDARRPGAPPAGGSPIFFRICFCCKRLRPCAAEPEAPGPCSWLDETSRFRFRFSFGLCGLGADTNGSEECLTLFLTAVKAPGRSEVFGVYFCLYG